MLSLLLYYLMMGDILPYVAFFGVDTLQETKPDESAEAPDGVRHRAVNCELF